MWGLFLGCPYGGAKSGHGLELPANPWVCQALLVLVCVTADCGHLPTFPSLPLSQPPAPLPSLLSSIHSLHSSDGEMFLATSSPQQNTEPESTSSPQHPWTHLSESHTALCVGKLRHRGKVGAGSQYGGTLGEGSRAEYPNANRADGPHMAPKSPLLHGSRRREGVSTHMLRVTGHWV